MSKNCQDSVNTPLFVCSDKAIISELVIILLIHHMDPGSSPG